MVLDNLARRHLGFGSAIFDINCKRKQKNAVKDLTILIFCVKMSSDDDDEFTLSVYNKAAVKSQFNKNLNQLKSQLKKPSNNVVVKDSKKDEEIIEEILHEETPVESVKPSNNKISKNGKKNKGKVRNGTPVTSPEQSKYMPKGIP